MPAVLQHLGQIGCPDNMRGFLWRRIALCRAWHVRQPARYVSVGSWHPLHSRDGYFMSPPWNQDLAED